MLPRHAKRSPPRSSRRVCCLLNSESHCTDRFRLAIYGSDLRAATAADGSDAETTGSLQVHPQKRPPGQGTPQPARFGGSPADTSRSHKLPVADYREMPKRLRRLLSFGSTRTVSWSECRVSSGATDADPAQQPLLLIETFGPPVGVDTNLARATW